MQWSHHDDRLAEQNSFRRYALMALRLWCVVDLKQLQLPRSTIPNILTLRYQTIINELPRVYDATAGPKHKLINECGMTPSGSLVTLLRNTVCRLGDGVKSGSNGQSSTKTWQPGRWCGKCEEILNSLPLMCTWCGPNRDPINPSQEWHVSHINVYVEIWGEQSGTMPIRYEQSGRMPIRHHKSAKIGSFEANEMRKCTWL